MEISGSGSGPASRIDPRPGISGTDRATNLISLELSLGSLLVSLLEFCWKPETNSLRVRWCPFPHDGFLGLGRGFFGCLSAIGVFPTVGNPTALQSALSLGALPFISFCCLRRGVSQPCATPYSFSCVVLLGRLIASISSCQLERARASAFGPLPAMSLSISRSDPRLGLDARHFRSA